MKIFWLQKMTTNDGNLFVATRRKIVKYYDNIAECCR